MYLLNDSIIVSVGEKPNDNLQRTSITYLINTWYTYTRNLTIAALWRECLDQYLFSNGREAQHIIEAWRHEYNYYRPHRSLDYVTPKAFAKLHPADSGLVAAAALPSE